MINSKPINLFDIELENKKGFRILKYHNPQEYQKNDRFLSLFDTGHVSGWIAIPIRPDEVERLIESNFSEVVVDLICFENGSSRFFLT